MTPDLVSIVIVVYNNWPDLELAIQSALQQSYRPIEVILVDNSSTDATRYEVPKRYGQRLQYIRQSNRGDSGGYNTGMHNVSGDFIQFLDGDDFLAPNKIEKQMEIFGTEPDVDIVYGDVRHFQSDSGIPSGWQDVDQAQYKDILATQLTMGGKGLMVQSMLFRRRILERVGDWDETMYVTDRDYLIRAAVAGCQFRYCPGVVYFYRIRAGQMSTNIGAMLHGMEALYVKALKYMTDDRHKDMARKLLAQVRLRMAVNQDGMTKHQALSKLRMARATDRSAISRVAYAIGWTLVIIPGARLLVHCQWLRHVRHVVARKLIPG